MKTKTKWAQSVAPGIVKLNTNSQENIRYYF